MPNSNGRVLVEGGVSERKGRECLRRCRRRNGAGGGIFPGSTWPGQEIIGKDPYKEEHGGKWKSASRFW